VSGRREPAHVHPDLGDDRLGADLAMSITLHSRSTWWPKGAISTSRRASTLAIWPARRSTWSRWQRSMKAWRSSKPPSKANRSSGILARERARAVSPSTRTSRSPAISAPIMLRGPLPSTLETTESSFMPASLNYGVGAVNRSRRSYLTG